MAARWPTMGTGRPEGRKIRPNPLEKRKYSRTVSNWRQVADKFLNWVGAISVGPGLIGAVLVGLANGALPMKKPAGINRGPHSKLAVLCNRNVRHRPL